MGNSAQCVAAWMGGEFRRKWIHVYVWLSSFAVLPDTITILFIGYTPIQIKSFLKKKTHTHKTQHPCGHLLVWFAEGDILTSVCPLAGNWQGFPGWNFADTLLLDICTCLSLSPSTSQDCLTGFSTGSFFELDSGPSVSYTTSGAGTLCHGCGQPITGRCVRRHGLQVPPSTSCAPSAWRSCPRGSSRSRRRSPTASPASTSSSWCDRGWALPSFWSAAKFKPREGRVRFVVPDLLLLSRLRGKAKVMDKDRSV